jgi:DNA polymerase-3 subunit delta
MVIFLYGEETFQSQEKLLEIKNKFLSKNPTGSGLVVFDFKEEKKNIDFAKISEAISSKGLFFSKQLLILKNLIGFAEDEVTEKTLNFLKKDKNIFEDQDLVVIFWEEKKISEKNKLFKLLFEKSKKQEFPRMDVGKLANWIAKKTKEENPKVIFSKEAVEKLISYTGGELFSIEQEIKKLANFKSEGIIEGKDVESLVNAKINSNIFNAIEAISCGDKKTALKLLHEQLEKGEDPHYIFSMYIYQFRNMLKVGEYFWQGNYNYNEIAKLAKLHPFVVKKTMAQLKNFNLEKMKEVYKKMEEMDIKIKTGKINPVLALDKLVTEI